jgi:hypothetical protein
VTDLVESVKSKGERDSADYAGLQRARWIRRVLSGFEAFDPTLSSAADFEQEAHQDCFNHNNIAEE